jgi:hypothetical protein
MRATGVVVIGANRNPVSCLGVIGERGDQSAAAVGVITVVHGQPPPREQIQ